MKKKLLLTACLALAVYGAERLTNKFDYGMVTITNPPLLNRTNYTIYFDDDEPFSTNNNLSWGTNVTVEIHTVYITNRFIRIQSPLEDKTILIKRLGTNVGDIYICPPQQENQWKFFNNIVPTYTDSNIK